MDDLRRIDLNLLVTLHAFLSERHVTRAAARLNKSQPAVSQALASLRAYFDDPLLVRRDGRLALTARAEQLVEPLETTLSRLNELLRAPTFDPSRAKARLRLALSDYAARIFLPGLTRLLRREAPGIDLAISQGSREATIAQLLDGDIDLALGIFPKHPAEIHFQELFRERFVCLADKAVLPRNGKLTVEDWLNRPHAMVALRPDAVEEIDHALADLGMRRRIALALPHWGVAIDVLPGTDLILTVARRAVRDMDKHKDLRLFEPPLEFPHLSYRQAWHKRRQTDLAHRWLREAVASCSVSET